MKKHILTIIMALVAFAASAQEDKRETVPDLYEMPASQPLLQTAPMQPMEFSTTPNSLHLPDLDDRGRVLSAGFYPYCFGGTWSNWRLHEGLNLSLGASVFSQFGKHAYGGVGFAQNISAQYAVALTPRLSVAVGGYLNNMFWASSAYRDAGLTAVLGYKFDEHWEGYLYGQKSMTTNVPIPLYLQDLNDMGDRIGAAVRYNVTPNFSVQMSVESRTYPHR